MQVLEWVDDLLQHPKLSCLLATIHTVSMHTPCGLIASVKHHMRPLLARAKDASDFVLAVLAIICCASTALNGVR